MEVKNNAIRMTLKQKHPKSEFVFHFNLDFDPAEDKWFHFHIEIGNNWIYLGGVAVILTLLWHAL